MGYLEAWKILEEMVADFRKRGKAVPAQVRNDLKSARTMIRILKSDGGSGEAAQKTEEYLGSVESYLISEGDNKFGAIYASEWLMRLDKARRGVGGEEEEKTTFVSGLPKEEKWIRVRPSAELAIESLKALADDSSVSYRSEDDGSLLVHGKKEHLADFVKKMATKYGSKAEK